MVVILIISAFLLMLASAANAVMDTLAHHYSGSIFARYNPLFWNPAESWKNKYKDSDHTKGAKFPGSTTIFVFMTDAWHLFKFVQINSYLIAISLLAWELLQSDWWVLILIFAIAKTMQGIIFNYLYHKTFYNPPP